MNDDRFRKAWQQQSHQDSGDDTALWTRMARMERTVFWRDVRETIAAGVVAVAFSAMVVFPLPALSRVGALLCVIASIVVVAVLHRARTHGRVDPTVPVRAYLETSLLRVRAQARLLRNVGWWYVGPLLVGMILVVIGMGQGVVMIGGLTLFCALVVVLNRWAAGRYLDPLAEDLTLALHDLDEPAAAD